MAGKRPEVALYVTGPDNNIGDDGATNLSDVLVKDKNLKKLFLDRKRVPRHCHFTQSAMTYTHTIRKNDNPGQV